MAVSGSSPSTQSRALATIGIGTHAEFLTYTGETFRNYARKHRYEYVQGSGAMPETRPLSWAKILLLQRLLEVFELVVWIDADATIVDDSRDIASDLAPDTWQAMVADRGGGMFSPNAGVWVLRRTPRTHEFLQAVWDSRDLINHPWWENAAVMRLLGFTYHTSVRMVDPSAPWLEGTQWLSAEWNRTPGPSMLEPTRIRHWAGMPMAFRVRQVRADCASVDGRRIRPALARLEWSFRSRHPFWFRVVSSFRYRVIQKPTRALQHAYGKVRGRREEYRPGYLRGEA